MGATKFYRSRPAKRLLPLALVLFVVACSENTSVSVDLQRTLESARNYQESHQFAAAMIEARKANQAFPGNPDVAKTIARILLETGRARQAIGTLEPVTPRDTEIALLLTRAYLDAGKERSASEVLEGISVPASGAAAVQHNVLLGRISLVQRDIETAINYYNRALQIEPGSTDALLGLVGTALADADYLKAHEHLNTILAIEPDQAEALLILAGLARRAGDRAEEEAYLMQAVASLPSADTSTPLRLAILTGLRDNLTSQGRSSDAAVYANILKELMPGVDERVQEMQAAIDLLREGRFTEARESLAAMNAQSESRQVSTLLAMIDFLQGDESAASIHFEDVVDPETTNLLALQMFATAELQLNRPEVVVERLSKDIDDNRDSRLNALYAVALALNGNPAASEHYFRKAIKWDTDSTNVRYHILLARFLDSVQRIDEIQDVLQKAYEKVPTDPLIQRELIGFYLAHGSPSDTDKFVTEMEVRFPEEQETQLMVAGYYLGQSRLEEGEVALKRVLAIGPSRLGQHLYADLLNKKANYSDAALEYRKLFEQNGEDRVALRGLIRTYELAGLPEKGLEELQVLNNTGEFEAIYIVLAEYYGTYGDLERSEEWLTSYTGAETAETREIWTRLIIAKARAATASGDSASGLKGLSEGLVRYPLNPRILSAMVGLNISLRNLEEAESYLIQLEAVNNDNSVSMLRGDLEKGKGNYLAAREAYNIAWNAVPSDRIAFKVFSTLQSAQRSPEEILEFLDDWVRQLPESNIASMTRANFLFINDEADKARGAYYAILENDQDNFMALNNLAWIYGNQDQVGRALELSQSAYELAGNQGYVLDTYGWFLFQAGQVPKAVQILREAVAMMPDNAEVRGHLTEAEAEYAEM